MKLLLIEDDKDLGSALRECLIDHEFEVEWVTDAQKGLVLANSDDFQMILSDIRMPNMSGYDFLKSYQQNEQAVPVLLMTAYGTIEQAVDALKLGACDYITKPFDMDTLLQKIKAHAIQSRPDKAIIAQSNKSTQLFDMAKKVAQTDASVLIQGESGTGKEVLARFIHQNSPRADKTFVGINCAAIPENMLEATLFGYEKGAFTGAVQSTPGKFELAQGGTLLLDEISEMPLSLQVKLLRVLQENEVERLGAKQTIDLDVRILATTNRTLQEEVKQGRFREDLYFRLNVFPLSAVALRERTEDIIPLCEYAITKYKSHKTLSDGAKRKLQAYGWPGNVRELENVIQRAIILAPEDTIEASHLIVETVSTVVQNDLSENLVQQEFKMIQEVLMQNQGSRPKTAEALGISPRTLRYKLAKMKKLGLIE